MSPTFSAKIRQNLPGLHHGPGSQVARHVTSLTAVTTSTRARRPAPALWRSSRRRARRMAVPRSPQNDAENVAGPGRGFLKL